MLCLWMIDMRLHQKTIRRGLQVVRRFELLTDDCWEFLLSLVSFCVSTLCGRYIYLGAFGAAAAAGGGRRRMRVRVPVQSGRDDVERCATNDRTPTHRRSHAGRERPVALASARRRLLLVPQTGHRSAPRSRHRRRRRAASLMHRFQHYL